MDKLGLFDGVYPFLAIVACEERFFCIFKSNDRPLMALAAKSPDWRGLQYQFKQSESSRNTCLAK